MTYELYISSLSPYSIKAAATLGYAGIPCRVKHENLVNRYAVLQRLTGQTMVPVLRRDDWAINDSTRIARWAEGQSERALVPEREGMEAVCWLLEEFADEWITRWMVFSRWCNDADARAAAREIGGEMTCGLPVVDRPLGRLASRMIKAQLGRGGARESNRVALEQSRDRILQALEGYFDATDGYLFGGEPTAADFALYGQLEQYRRDPTGEDRMQVYPAISEWLDAVDRMRVPHPVVAIRHGAEMELDKLRPLFGEMFGTYWRVIVAMHRARSEGLSRDDGPVRVELLDGTQFEAAPSRYVAGRVKFVLRQLDRLVAAEPELLGPNGLGIDDAVNRAVERLSGEPSGRELLEDYPSLFERV